MSNNSGPNQPFWGNAGSNQTASGAYAASGTTHRKHRSLAIALAVVLTFWSYLYTYKVDRKKFWLFLPLGIVLGNLALNYHIAIAGLLQLVIWGYIVYDVVKRPGDFYEQYPNLQP